MKTVYVLTNEQGIVGDITREIEKFKSSLMFIGSAMIDQNGKQDINFKQPDFILTTILSQEDAMEIYELCQKATIIMISDDMNRSNALINNLQKNQIYNITAIDANNVNPNSLMQEMARMANDEETSLPEKEKDVFGDAFDDNNDVVINTEKPIEEQVESKPLENPTKNNFEVEQNQSEPNTIFETKTETNDKRKVFSSNLSNVRSKCITVYSKKGGTGKTTLAKELANIYASVKLPRKLQNGNDLLRTVIVDLDFERGNLRTMLGISNPNPNIYIWINDILDRIENKTPINRIYFNQFQVITYLLKVNNSFGNLYTLVTGQGGIPLRTMYRISKLDSNGHLLTDIINIILKSLKACFDIVILDTDSTYNEITNVALKHADNIIYPLEPTITDLENLKVFTDEMMVNKEVNPENLGLVLNKGNKKINFNSSFLDVLSLIKYKAVDYKTGNQIEKVYTLISDLPYDLNVIDINNSYMFITNGGTQEIKKGILKICEYCLPVFKVKYTTAGVKQLEALYRKKHKKDIKEETRRKLEEKRLKKAKTGTTTQKSNESNTITENDKAEVLGNLPELSLKEYVSSDLRNVTYDDFVGTLKKTECKKSHSGFPMIKNKPKQINRKVWSQYQKALNKELKEGLKLRREANKKQ